MEVTNASAILGQPLIGTTLPVSQTLSVTNGPTAEATYNFSDSGNTASLEISTMESLNGPNQTATESSELDVFYLTQPVTYHFVFQDTLSPGLNSGGVAGIVGVCGTPSQGLSNASYESDGTLQAGIKYELSEGFQLNDDSAGLQTTDSGTSDVLLTLAAIPEPSSLCLLAAIGTGLLSRRRQPRAAGTRGRSPSIE